MSILPIVLSSYYCGMCFLWTSAEASKYFFTQSMTYGNRVLHVFLITTTLISFFSFYIVFLFAKSNAF